MQLTLHVTRRTPQVSLRFFGANKVYAWSAKTRRAPSRHCGDARLHGHATGAMHDMSTHPPPPPRFCPGTCSGVRKVPGYQAGCYGHTVFGYTVHATLRRTHLRLRPRRFFKLFFFFFSLENVEEGHTAGDKSLVDCCASYHRDVSKQATTFFVVCVPLSSRRKSARHFVSPYVGGVVISYHPCDIVYSMGTRAPQSI